MKKCGYCARKHDDNAVVCPCGTSDPFGYNRTYGQIFTASPQRVVTVDSAYVEGYDVSFWQDLNSTPQKIDFEKMRSTGRVFCGIRASQATHADSDFGDNYRNARGIMSRFAYHYLDWTKPFVDQVDFFWSVIRDDIGEIGPCLDYEEWEGAPGPGTARQQYRDACGRLQYLLQSVGWDTINHKQQSYTAPGYWEVFGSPDLWWMLNTDLFLAHWNAIAPTVPRPWYSYTLWQYSVKGDGIAAGCESLQIDCDRLNPSTPFSAWSLPLPGAPGPDPEPEPEPEEIMQKWKVVTAELSVRNKPKDMDGSIVLAKAPAGTVFVGTGRQMVKPEWPHQHWVEINYNGGVAWIADLYYANGIPLAVTVA